MNELEMPAFNLDSNRQWLGIVLHHSATADGLTNDWEGIRHYHTSWRRNGVILPESEGIRLKAAGASGVEAPWRDIGYHFGIEKEGDQIKIKLGRSLAMVGAHAVGFNHTHLGVCIVGCFDKEAPPQEKWDAAIALVRNLKYIFKFEIDKVIGHRETFTIRGVPVEKSCPGSRFDLGLFRQAI